MPRPKSWLDPSKPDASGIASPDCRGRLGKSFSIADFMPGNCQGWGRIVLPDLIPQTFRRFGWNRQQFCRHSTKLLPNPFPRLWNMRHLPIPGSSSPGWVNPDFQPAMGTGFRILEEK